MHRVRASILISLTLTMLAVAVGCEPSAMQGRTGVYSASDSSDWKKPPPRKALSGSSPSQWPFWPVRMRIHPLTRLVISPTKDGTTPANQWIIETRIEFQDADGLPSKACGQLAIQMYESPSMQTDQGRVKTWNVDLRDLAVNRAQFDDITRTYLFRLAIKPAELTEQSQLRATFASEDGQTFEDRLLVRH